MCSHGLDIGSLVTCSVHSRTSYSVHGLRDTLVELPFCFKMIYYVTTSHPIYKSLCSHYDRLLTLKRSLNQSKTCYPMVTPVSGAACMAWNCSTDTRS